MMFTNRGPNLQEDENPGKSRRTQPADVCKLTISRSVILRIYENSPFVNIRH